MQEWPSLGHDIESGGLGVCAGTSFNLPAAANRIGLRVGYVATIGNDVWSRMILDEFNEPTLKLPQLGETATISFPEDGPLVLDAKAPLDSVEALIAEK